MKETEAFRILLVDDSPDDRELIIHELKRKSRPQELEIDTLSSGEECIECLKADPGRYDLIILDYLLPDRDGLQVLDELNPILATARQRPAVILLSGFGDEILETQAIEKSAYVYLNKDAAELRALHLFVRSLKIHKRVREKAQYIKSKKGTHS